MSAPQAAGEEAPNSGRSVVKVVLVGDGGCGKTSLMMVYADGAFPDVSALTLGLATSLPWDTPVSWSCLLQPLESTQLQPPGGIPTGPEGRKTRVFQS